MKEYGYVIISDGEIIERIGNEEELKARFLDSVRKDELMTFRRITFDELTENEKIDKMSSKLKDLNEYLDNIRGSGRTYYSHTNIEAPELKWLIENTEKYLSLSK